MILVVATILAITGVGKITDFWARVRQGLAILREPRRYLREVAAWQALDWVFRLAAIFSSFGPSGCRRTSTASSSSRSRRRCRRCCRSRPRASGPSRRCSSTCSPGTAPASDVLSFSVGVKLVVIAVNLTLGTIATLATLRKFPWHVDVDKEAAERA